MKYQENQPLFSISVTSKIIGITPRVLRSYEEAGLVCPYRTEGNTRLYSQLDVRRLQLIYYLHKEKEVNLPGIKIILDLLSSYLEEEIAPDVYKVENNISTSEENQKSVEADIGPGDELIEKIKEVAPELLPGKFKD